ncbi:MAG: nitroreductase family deazaflavin-dependent oxidoreductase [Acidimicrobiia bacterium]|nr:nitroreductase family deazaflavin-dependent oxidoreductase [Acidimicrobiia bacterium]
MPFPRWLAKVNKRFTNRYLLELADQPPFAALHHRGRNSGEIYRIPLNAFPCDGGFVFALTYGSHSDWVQNVLAAGGAELEYDGQRLVLTDPHLVSRDQVQRCLPATTVVPLGLLRVREFLTMRRL